MIKEVWTNLAYILAGVVCAWQGWWAIAALYVLLGVTSFGYHWWAERSMKPIGRDAKENSRVMDTVRRWARADVASTFALLIGIGLTPLLAPLLVFPIAVVGGVALRYGLVRYTPVDTSWVTALLAVGAFISAIHFVGWGYAALGLAVLVLASVFQGWAQKKLTDFPVKEDHGLWHILAAIGTKIWV